MNPEVRTVHTWILVLHSVSILIGVLGGLVVSIVGPESSIGRIVIFSALAIACLATGFGMALGYSISWAGHAVKPPAPTPDAPFKSQ